MFTNESQESIKQYLHFNLNENHDDDESDCINADDINDDDQDAHTSVDGDAEDSDEKDSQNSNNINKNIIHKKNAIRLYSIAIVVHSLYPYCSVVLFLLNKELPFSSVGEPPYDHGHIFA